MTYSGQVLMLVNFAVCFAIAYACLCRLNSYSCKYDKWKRTKYTIMVTAALLSAFQKAVFNETPSMAGLVVALAVLIGLLIHMPRWARKDKMYGALNDSR